MTTSASFWQFLRLACRSIGWKRTTVSCRPSRRRIIGIFFLYTALLIFHHVLSSGPVYANRVHAALSVYILLALAWACMYGLIEIISPGAFSLGATSTDTAARPQGAYLLADMIHLSITTLTSIGYGDVTPSLRLRAQ